MLYRFFRAEKKLKGSTIEAKIEPKMSLKDEKRGGHAPEAQTRRHPQRPLRLLLFSSFASFFMIGGIISIWWGSIIRAGQSRHRKGSFLPTTCCAEGAGILSRQ